MYIKSIILDGFKSYGRRTEINGFDPQFNAVTGLNGSGKSNIIDSICFLLGITNLTNVRVTNLQDLIYKSGQSGINKATVTIKFDNTNKNQAPPGFESYNEIVITRQIVLGGKTKYLLNGLNVANKHIQDLFCSIQLNVNNPHFLIMQGKITKVLNMKPPEILGMVEEAAGTRMYEVKRQLAVKNLEKKDAKLEELEKLFYEDVEPKFTKLQEERARLFELQRLEGELSHKMKLLEAWQCHVAKTKAVDGENDIKTMEKNIQDIRDKIQENINDIKILENEAEVAMKETEDIAGAQLKELETKLKEKIKLETEINAIEKASTDNISSEERNVTQLEKSLKTDENALKNKEQELDKVKNLYETLKNNENSDAEALAACQKKYEAICAGMEVNESGEAQTLMSQHMSVKQEMMQLETDVKVCRDELAYYQQQLRNKETNLGSGTASYAQDKAQLERLMKEIKNLNETISKLNYSEDNTNQLQVSLESIKKDMTHLKENKERFYASKPHARFVYADPEPNFNKKNVHGVVCDLIEVENKAYCTAIEIAAGGMLYSVVVTDNIVSKKLIERGQLQHRTTFIPLNKIKAKRMSPNIVTQAYNLVGEENVTPALDVISYDECLQPAMESIFGNVFIAKDLNIAKQVCFHDGIRRKCVTLEGDVVDPAGTLSGGSRERGSSLLLQLDDVKKQKVQFKQMEKEYFKLQSEMQVMGQSREKWVQHTTELELLQHESTVISKRLEQTTHHMQVAEIEQLKSDIAQGTERLKLGEQKLRELQTVYNDMEHKIKDPKKHQEQQRKEIEAELKSLKIKAEKSHQEWTQREEEYRTLNLEIEELKKTITSAAAEIKTSKENVINLRQKHQTSNEEAINIKNIVKELQEAVKAEKAAIATKNKAIQQKYRVKDKLIEQNNEHELEIKKMEYEFDNVKIKQQVIKDRFNELRKKCKDVDLLNEAKEMSNEAGMALENKIREDMKRKNELSKTVNVKAHQMYEHEAKAFENLNTKLTEVRKDVVLIKEAIKKLDKKKEEILNKAYQQITKDMGSILGTLLPGADAKLKIPNRKTILEGLEIKVALGGVWKESLDELSGGQRSLVALSFILAMLLFKPAPLYILDEVDAALDLSHTQNIGGMLKQHFQQSQFIIISLKDGMFNNANVLFRTQFIDGVSTVTRSTNL